MEITLSKRLGLKGADMVHSWVASVINDTGDIIIQGKAITANGALREVETKLEESLRTIREMKFKSEETTDS